MKTVQVLYVSHLLRLPSHTIRHLLAPASHGCHKARPKVTSRVPASLCEWRIQGNERSHREADKEWRQLRGGASHNTTQCKHAACNSTPPRQLCYTCL